MSVKTVITDGGLELLRAAPNHKLVYTRAACGSGSVAGTELAELTDVADYVMDLSIVDVKPTETAATIRLQLDNSKAPREFQLHQIGVFAKLLDGDDELMGETLLQVMQYEQPDIVRAIPHISEYVVNTLMGQAETVEGVIDHAAYVSIRQHKKIVDELQAKIAEQEKATDSLNENLALNSYTATLLNGWKPTIDFADYIPSIVRTGNVITVTSYLEPGIVDYLTTIFMLPDWAIPIRRKVISVINKNGSYGLAMILPNGRVVADVGFQLGVPTVINITYGINETN